MLSSGAFGEQCLILALSRPNNVLLVWLRIDQEQLSAYSTSSYGLVLSSVATFGA